MQEVAGQTKESIQNIADASMGPASNIARKELTGTEEMRRFITPDQSFEKGLGGEISQPAISDAINRRSLSKYGEEYGALKSRTNYQAMNEKFKRLSEAANLVAMENEHNQRVREMRYQIAKQRKAARGAMLGSILGIGGAVAGFAVGGPAGAMAGSQIGTAVGQNIGGS